MTIFISDKLKSSLSDLNLLDSSLIEKIIFASRWLQSPIYILLTLILIAFTYEIAKELFPNGAGSMLCFGVKGEREGGAVFINAVKLSSNLANVGDSRTLVLHPASTTHSRLDDEAMKASGTSPDLIRVSVGIESINDIIN